MNDFLAMLRNWKTTVIGLVPLVASLLSALGVVQFTPEEATEAVGGAFEGIIAAILGVIGLIGLFSRDADKSSQDSGIR